MPWTVEMTRAGWLFRLLGGKDVAMMFPRVVRTDRVRRRREREPREGSRVGCRDPEGDKPITNICLVHKHRSPPRKPEHVLTPECARPRCFLTEGPPQQGWRSQPVPQS